MSEPIVKTFISEVKGVNEKDFTLEAVISDETIDRYGEIIKVDAWKKRLGRYKNQAVLLSSHKYDKLTNQIGKAEKVKVEDGKLIAKFKYFAGEGNEEADWGWKLASKYGMAAYSVGFLPYSYDDAEWDEDVKSGKKACRTYTDVELLEVSQVLVPANPTAMMRSMETLDVEKDEPIRKYFELVQKDFADYEEIVKEDLNAKDAEDIIETKPDTENYVHIGVSGEEGKHSGHAIKTITISSSEGIKAHYCTETDCKKITGYMFNKEKGWTHEKAQEWVDEHSKAYEWFNQCQYLDIGDKTVNDEVTTDCVLGIYLWGFDTPKSIKTLYDFKDDINDVILGKKKKPCGPKGKDITEEEDMGEVLDTIKALEEKVDFIKQWIEAREEEEELFNKQLEEDFKELESIQTKAEIDDGMSYIRQLLEDTNSILEKTISVQPH
jgi:hypothetical protein